MKTTRVGIVGCGFVADYYAATLAAYPDLEVVAVHDRNRDRADRFAEAFDFDVARTLDELLERDSEIVVNLTNPNSHAEVSSAALCAGKHVYSEKPMAMDLDDARRLVELAEGSSLQVSSAPCGLLGESAQTMWRAIRRGQAGDIHLIYAEMDEGLVHRMPFDLWKSSTGAPWPFRDEFEVGTVIEHAGYVTGWLPAMFGPVDRITGFADTRILDKAACRSGTDFSVAVLSFRSGVIARITCSLIAPHDHSLRVIGDRGVISVADTWDYGSRVHLRQSVNVRQRHQWLPRRPLRRAGRARRYRYRGGHQMDFARGVAELASSLREGRESRLSSRYSLHVNEITLALSEALRLRSTYEMTTTFDPIDPMDWAR